MELQYKPILTLDLKHSYYADGRCKDFEFIFPEQTRRLFQKGRLIPKQSENSLQIYAAFQSGLLATDLDSKRLVVGLKLKNPHFYNFTEKLPIDGVRLFTNQADPAALGEPIGAAVVGQGFTHRVSGGQRPVEIQLRSDGEILQSYLLEADENSQALEFLLPDSQYRELEVRELYDGDTESQHYLCIDDFVCQPIDHVVDLRLQDDFAADPPVFSLDFASRQETLSYYIVARNYGSSIDLITVSGIDNSFRNEPVPIDFIKVPSSHLSNRHLPKEVMGIDSDSKVVLFHSVNPVARRDRSNIQVELSLSGDTLIPALPLSGPEQLNADFIVHLPEPKS